jgi:hypothetical protein
LCAFSFSGVNVICFAVCKICCMDVRVVVCLDTRWQIMRDCAAIWCSLPVLLRILCFMYVCMYEYVGVVYLQTIFAAFVYVLFFPHVQVFSSSVCTYGAHGVYYCSVFMSCAE